MTTAEGKRWANTIFALSHGGYICGDLDLADLREGERSAEAAYKLIGQTPPWWRSTRTETNQREDALAASD
jgi:hypothetical protein